MLQREIEGQYIRKIPTGDTHFSLLMLGRHIQEPLRLDMNKVSMKWFDFCVQTLNTDRNYA